MYRKSLVYAIILLFILASFMSFSSGDFCNKNKVIKINESITFSNENWWSIFHHDIAHSSYSTSLAPNINNILWNYTDGSSIYSSLAIVDGKVYFGSMDFKVYFINALNGTKIGDYLTEYYPMFSSPAVAYGRIFISDMIGNLFCFGEPNDPTNKPNIYGPENGTTNVEYTFCTDTITDPEGDQIYCFWDWGDSSNSGWLGPYDSGQTICTSHIWTEPGVYCILLKLKDDYGWESEYSDPFCITITENQKPSAPFIDGPNHVKIGIKSTWSFISIDPEGDNITYYIDWGDKCGGAEYHGPYPSGQNINISHKYTIKNTLIINALAIDSKGAESDITFFEVKISRDRAFTNLFLQFFDSFPRIFIILKTFLGNEIFLNIF